MKKDRSLSDELVVHPRQLKIHASLAILAKDIATILEKNFPGWAWAIEPDQEGMIINIKNLHLHDEWGYTIRTAEIHNDPKRRLAYTAGREILQRFGLEARGIGQQAATLAMLPRDASNRVVPNPERIWDAMTRQQKEKAKVTEQAQKIQKMVEAYSD